MKLTDLEHIIRAAGEIAGQRELVIIGSQAILGQFPNAPEALLQSREADVYFPGQPELAQKVEGAIGELSPFDDTHGYYAGSADDRTSTLPPGWRKRLIPIGNPNTNGITGWCLEVHDIAVAKYAAGREKDDRYIAVLWAQKMINLDTIEDRIKATHLDPARRTVLLARAHRDAKTHGGLDDADSTKSTLQELAKRFKPPKTGTERNPRTTGKQGHERE